MENYTLPTKLLSTLSKQCNSIFRHFVTGYVKVCVDKQEPENRGQSGLPGWTMLLQGKVDFLVGSCHCCQAHLDVRVGQCVPSSATSGEQGSTCMTRCRIPAALSPVLRAWGHALSQTQPQLFKSTKLTLLWTHPGPHPPIPFSPQNQKASPGGQPQPFRIQLHFPIYSSSISSKPVLLGGSSMVCWRTGQVPELVLSFGQRSNCPPPLSTEAPFLKPFSVVNNPVYMEIWTTESKWPPLPKSQQVQRNVISL